MVTVPECRIRHDESNTNIKTFQDLLDAGSPRMEGENVEYLRGFTHGMHFLLQALEGRMTGCADAWDVSQALDEYRALVEQYRGGSDLQPPAPAPSEFTLADVAW